MPARAPDLAKQQEEDRLLKRLQVFLDIVDTSDHEGEQLNAVRLAGRLLRDNNMRWADVTGGHERARIIEAANAELAAEVLALQQRNAELEAERSHCTNVALWSNVDAKPSRNRVLAAWVLDLHRQGRTYLSPREIEFLGTSVPRWTGALTPKQAAWFQDIVDGVVERTGQTPPFS